MRFKAAVLSTTLAALLLTTPALAEPGPAPEGQKAHAGDCHRGKEGKMLRKLARMERRLDRAVERGHLTQAQADQFKAEARQLRQEFESQRSAGNGHATGEQKQQLRQRKQALRQKVKAAIKPSKSQDV